MPDNDDAQGTVKARILRETELDGETFKVNEVVEFDAHTATELVSQGAIDVDPAAVAYAESLSPAA